MIRVFKRSTWKRNKAWPGGYEPYGRGTKRTVCHVNTEEEAREICIPANKERTRKDEPFYEFERV